MTDEELNKMNKTIRKRYKQGWTILDIAEYMCIIPEEVKMALKEKTE